MRHCSLIHWMCAHQAGSLLGPTLDKWPADNQKLWTIISEEWCQLNHYHPKCTIKLVKNCEPLVKSRKNLECRTIATAINAILAPVDLTEVALPFEEFPLIKKLLYLAARVTMLKFKLDEIIERKNDLELTALSQ